MNGTLTRSCAGLALALLCGAAAAADVVERRVVMPEPDRPHAEARIVRRDDVTVVQTLVHSRSVRRVARAIADKERANWPPGSEGADAAARFIDTLAEVAAAVRDAPAGEDRRRSLCIEFPPGGPVTISGATVESAAGGLRLVALVEPTVSLEFGRSYVGRNRVLIVADAFSVDEATAAEWLESAGTEDAHPDSSAGEPDTSSSSPP